MSWQQHRRLTPQEYQSLVSRLGMNKSQAGRYLGVSVRTAQRYWDGLAAVPTAAVLLLHALMHHRELPQVPLWEGRKEFRKPVSDRTMS